MENKHILKLIDGKFTPSEAGKVLFELISRKINHHQMEIFSNEERFGKDLSNSKNRIDELRVTNDYLKNIIDSTSIKQELLQISCFIEINILNRK